MQILPIDLTEIVAIILGISVVLVPVIGLTARFALKPAVEALSHVFESRNTNETIQILERRISLLESQIEALEQGQRTLEAKTSFDAQLGSGPGRTALPEGSQER